MGEGKTIAGEGLAHLHWPMHALTDRRIQQQFAWEDVRYEGQPGPFGPLLYSDGCAYEPTWVHLRRAGWCDVELCEDTGDVLRAAWGPVPRSLSPDRTV
eukprot:6485783-Amphidinium_carterae.1